MTKKTTPARGAEKRHRSSGPKEQSRDASLEFKTTPDKMAAFISSYTPAQGDGEQISIELMERELERSGHKGQLDPDGANFALKRAKEGKSIINVALVRGTYPQNAHDGMIITDADLAFPVLPGMEFGRLSPAGPAAPGLNLVGEEVPPADTHKPVPLNVRKDGGCTHNAQTGALVSERYGIVKTADNEIYVDSLIRISPDAMQVSAMFYPHDCYRMRYDISSIKHALDNLGISRPIQHAACQTALTKARESSHACEAVIVQGTEPVPGKDGYFEYASREKTGSVGTTGEDDRIDFKDRGVHPMVNPGDVIGKIHPPVEGKAGEDVYGRLTPPPGGNPLEIRPGPGVAPLDDGISYTATTTGIVHIEAGLISVTDVLVTKGDVNYSTGHIRLEKGSVHVSGSIREGFSVEAPEHIVVQESVEGSKVTAGGDIEVKGGLVMAGKGSIKAGGTLTAQFSSNARIECGDELLITNEITNSIIHCKGPVTAHGGKGIIQGGTVMSATGIEAKELGSEIGVKTIVGITSRPPVNRELVKERDELRARLLKINQAVGESPSQVILESTPEAKRPQMEKILILRGQTKIKLKEIRKRLAAELDEYYRSLEMLSIRVHRRVYPGVEIKIGGKTVQIAKTINRIKFRFDAEERAIIAVKF
ncbi:FapA family protein [Maridesulfovibrio sp.]|uniref:FapA family protein n=1 Tax=Maridesulfovibrio sp. TaxID=2795000 RepID=UPI002A18B3FC|nr:FapA family protein [Maridesulfovibrio sp.]